MGIIFCNKARKLIPNFGKSQKTKAAIIIKVIMIRTVFCCMKMFLLEPKISFNEVLFFFLCLVLNNGRSNHTANEIKIIKKIRRTI